MSHAASRCPLLPVVFGRVLIVDVVRARGAWRRERAGTEGLHGGEGVP